MGDVLDVAVSGEDALLILASKEGDLDLLALVFVRVVLDARSVANPLSSVTVVTRRWPLNADGEDRDGTERRGESHRSGRSSSPILT
jgi:hypothetical protein